MKVVLVVCSFLTLTVNAQIIDNSECKAFSDEPFFNEVFIKNNKVKSIRGSIQTKKKLQAMQTRGLETYYKFTDEGELDYQYKTRVKSGGKKDTTIVTYLYDDLGRLNIKRRNDSYGFYSYNYEYDSTGELSSEKYCRDKNVGPSKHEFELGKQYVIVSETFENQRYGDTMLVRRFFNNYGRPYQEKTFKWDDKGYLKSEETFLLLNRKRNKTTYEYNAQGQVVRKVQSSNVTKNSELVFEYTYDEVGNLLECDEYRDGVHITKREVLYDKATMLMKAIIVVDVSTEYMSLVKYEYEYYE